MKKIVFLLPLFALLSCKKGSSILDMAQELSNKNGTSTGGGTSASGKVLLVKEVLTLNDPTTGPEVYDVNYLYDTKGTLTKMTSGAEEFPLLYNSAGQLMTAGKAGPDNDVYTFTYDAAGNLTDATENEYDSDGKLDRTQYLKYVVTNGLVTQTSVYNAAKQLVYVHALTYDARGNVSQSATKDAAGKTLENTVYTYGTNQNPKLSIRFKFHFDPARDVDDVATNELLSVKTVDPSGTATNTYQYTYTKGYPVTCKFSIAYSSLPNLVTTGTEAYTYTGL